MLSADKVLVTVGTACTVSAVGSTETERARVAASPDFIALAALDAGLVESDPAGGHSTWRWADGPDAGRPATAADIEARWGSSLRAGLGIRKMDASIRASSLWGTDLAACLPHDFERGGLRRLGGLRQDDVRESALKDMGRLFDDDAQLGPSLQSQLFTYSGLGALAGLPISLSDLVEDPHRFRIFAGCAFAGLDSLGQWLRPDAPMPEPPSDRFAVRLSHSLSTNGPALLAAMLSPAYSLSRTLKNPALRDSLRAAEAGYLRVPQAPLVASAACASALVAFCDLASHLLFDYPGLQRTQLALLTAADASLQPGFGLLDVFGGSALMSKSKLDAVNQGRAVDEARAIGDALAPFDVDADGTVIGHAGSGLMVTTLDFALRHFLDISSIVVGWGQSSEAGGKEHFAGVGFGGENAIVQALDMAHRAHGYGIEDFGYLVAHATGTRTNSKTDLFTVQAGRSGAALRQGYAKPLPPMRVGAPKALGDGHTMGETGLKAIAHAVQYLLAQPAPGIPTLRRIDPELAELADRFVLRSEAWPGDADGGALCASQGFGGYNGAVALRSAHPQALRRYACDPKVLDAYLERWPKLRGEREQRERQARRGSRLALAMAERHRWLGEF